MQINIIYNEDCSTGLCKLPNNSVDCCITSPPYFNLRDYGIAGQIGLEDTPEAYIHRLVKVFREVWRVLKPTGTLWVNIGDSYAGSGKGGANYPDSVSHTKQGTNRGMVGADATVKRFAGYKDKDLIGIPWMLAFALRSDGWYLRQDIVWAKSNPMPESVRDRCTKSHEYIFLLSKSKRYYFDYAAIARPAKTSSRAGTVQAVGSRRYEQLLASDPQQRTNTDRSFTYTETARKRDVWFMPTNPYKGAHFATFPIELITDCILAGSPEGGGGNCARPVHGCRNERCRCANARPKLYRLRVESRICTHRQRAAESTTRNVYLTNRAMKLLYIDLFCGAGGTSTGVELARVAGQKCAKVIA